MDDDKIIQLFPKSKKSLAESLTFKFSDMDCFIQVVNMMADFTHDETIPEVVRRRYLNKLKNILLMEDEQ